MIDYDLPSGVGRNRKRILLIGDVDRAFAAPDDVRQLGWRQYDKIAEGIAAAGGERFDLIGVVISSLGTKLRSTLLKLRRVGGDAKIVLLAQMYEEPQALQMVRWSPNGKHAADDYVICPVKTNQFAESVLRTGREEAAASAGEKLNYDDDTTIRELIKMATEDDLTGMKNRRYVKEFLRQIITRAEKEGSKVTVLLFDIDNFKHYNDVYGHSAGDSILKQASILMQRCCRSHDIVGRIGGDEFAVIFWDNPKEQSSEAERRAMQSDHPKEAVFIAERVRKELNATEMPLLGPEGQGVLTISGGLASFPGDGSRADELFEQADKALLEAKRSGKNRIYLVGRPQENITQQTE
jgi:diguanylate cyclase (GGDEF)-like protein